MNILSTAMCFTPDWLRLQRSCFKEFTEKVNWYTAQQTCQSINSNLTSIHSAKENDFVSHRVAASSESIYWIGLNDFKNNTVYEWVDGSDVSFTNWGPTEPNSGGIDNCTESNYGRWNDLACSTHRSFVCGKEWNPWAIYSVWAPMQLHFYLTRLFALNFNFVLFTLFSRLQ